MVLIETAREINPATIGDCPDEAFLDWAFEAEVMPLAPVRRFARAPAAALDRERSALGSLRTAIPASSGSIAGMPARLRRERMAILAADVAGYSRLVERDDVDAVHRIRTLRRHLVEPAAALHQARLVRLVGDGLMMAFCRAGQALACAVGIQRTLSRLGRIEPAPLHLQLRIGLSLGDVIFEDDDLHGHSVNVAARLEALAETGGILMCGEMHEAVRSRLDLPSEALGYWRLKNLARLVAVHRIRAADLQG